MTIPRDEFLEHLTAIQAARNKIASATRSSYELREELEQKMAEFTGEIKVLDGFSEIKHRENTKIVSEYAQSVMITRISRWVVSGKKRGHRRKLMCDLTGVSSAVLIDILNNKKYYRLSVGTMKKMINFIDLYEGSD